ncbi:hypothetical protein BVRB_019250, partial [Beta vulgaris subsp. vulgaris]
MLQLKHFLVSFGRCVAENPASRLSDPLVNSCSRSNSDALISSKLGGNVRPAVSAAIVCSYRLSFTLINIADANSASST